MNLDFLYRFFSEYPIFEIMRFVFENKEKDESAESKLIEKFGKPAYFQFSQFCFGKPAYANQNSYDGRQLISLTPVGARAMFKLKASMAQQALNVILSIATVIMAFTAIAALLRP